MKDSAPFLDLSVGRFRLALRAHRVLAVIQDAAAGPRVQARDDEVPLFDLHPLFEGGKPRATIPFVVIVETGDSSIGIGVDTIGHLRGEARSLIPVPTFGLHQQAVFEGVLRISNDLLLVLRAEALPSALDLWAQSKGGGNKRVI